MPIVSLEQHALFAIFLDLSGDKFIILQFKRANLVKTGYFAFRGGVISYREPHRSRENSKLEDEFSSLLEI